jgi:pimeloyl-ACP methyl ester carboxylesterase
VALVDDRRDVAGMDRAFLTAARSLLLLLADPRLMRRAMAGLQVPVLLVHGDRDRLVPVSVARDVARRHRDWRYVELPGVGHVPQLQCPELLAEHLLAWLPTVARVP